MNCWGVPKAAPPGELKVGMPLNERTEERVNREMRRGGERGRERVGERGRERVGERGKGEGRREGEVLVLFPIAGFILKLMPLFGRGRLAARGAGPSW